MGFFEGAHDNIVYGNQMNNIDQAGDIIFQPQSHVTSHNKSTANFGSVNLAPFGNTYNTNEEGGTFNHVVGEQMNQSQRKQGVQSRDADRDYSRDCTATPPPTLGSNNPFVRITAASSGSSPSPRISTPEQHSRSHSSVAAFPFTLDNTNPFVLPTNASPREPHPPVSSEAYASVDIQTPKKSSPSSEERTDLRHPQVGPSAQESSVSTPQTRVVPHPVHPLFNPLSMFIALLQWLWASLIMKPRKNGSISNH